jgi:glutathione synthase/RimK-type ligase-like ATP-grasp enzyme
MVTILLGDPEDLHLTAIASRLDELGAEYLVVGLSDNFGLVSSRVACGEPPLELSLAGRRVTANSIRSVLDRSRSSMPILTDESWQYAFRERKAFLDSLAFLARDARWMNPLASVARASNKIAQLIAAERSGLRVPATVVTNDAMEVRRFLKSAQDGTVFKALTWLATSDGRVLFTNEINDRLLGDLEESLRVAPCIFQKKIRKRYELRVTCVGREVFATKIWSQERESTSLDWRRDQGELRHEPYELPPSVQRAIARIMSELGIVFGAFDLACSLEGDYVFFEVNPGGNWLWIEEDLGIPISRSVARWLRLVDTDAATEALLS